MRLSIFGSIALFVVLSGGPLGVASGQATQGPLPFVNSDGTIRFPGRVRDDDNWVHLGSWGSADLNSADPGQHDVYTQRESLEAYLKTGKFPDGAVIVKEVRKIESGYMTTGPVTWAGDEVLWFVLIKDAKGRFPGNDHWGEGWGWALFNAGATEKNASINFRVSCLSCHVPAHETDWIYVQGYPRLRAVHDRPE
jgi:cytochrome c